MKEIKVQNIDQVVVFVLELACTTNDTLTHSV